MQIYPSGAALAAHMHDLSPERAAHALVKRFDADFKGNPDMIRDDIAQCWWHLPPPDIRFVENRTLVPST